LRGRYTDIGNYLKLNTQYLLFIDKLNFNLMKLSILLLFLFSAFQICYSQNSLSLQYKLDHLKHNIDTLDLFIGVYPTNIKNEVEQNFVQKTFSDAESELMQLEKQYPNNAIISTLQGNLYQLGHNFDKKDSWILSENYFKKAIEIDPTEYKAHFGLGHLYVTTDMKYAEDAEKELLIALKSPDNKIKNSSYLNLSFAKYYQGKFIESKKYLERYISLTKDKSVEELLKIINEKITQNK